MRVTTRSVSAKVHNLSVTRRALGGKAGVQKSARDQSSGTLKITAANPLWRQHEVPVALVPRAESREVRPPTTEIGSTEVRAPFDTFATRETLSGAHAEMSQGIPSALQERERSLRQALGAKSDRLIGVLNGPDEADEVASLRKEIDELLTQYQDVEGEIRESSPRYAAVTQAHTLALGGGQWG